MRTVFLPKGSPGICSVRGIKADVRHFEVAAEGGRVFCSGEADLLIEYLSFAPGKQYPGYEDYEQQLSGGGSMWQALLTIPFELTGTADLACPPLAELAVGEMNWFMVSPHALEMEIDLCLSWQENAAPSLARTEEAEAGWQQITLADVENANAHKDAKQNNLNTSRTKTKGECLNMEHDDKIMRMGVSDQGWQIVTHTQEPEQQPAQETAEQETSILAAAIEEVVCRDTVVMEQVVVEEAAAEEVAVEEVAVEEVVLEEIIVEEMIVEEFAVEEPLSIPTAPLLNIQTVETPWQPPFEPETVVEAPTTPMQMERPAIKSRAAGLPRLHVRHEQIHRSSYQVNYQIDDK